MSKTTKQAYEFKSAANDLGLLTPLIIPFSILLGALIISLSVYFSFRGANFNFNVAGKSTAGATTTGDTAGAAQETNPASQTTIDDDPYLGNKDSAKVAIVEFSDYECPYCKSHFQETYRKLLDNYVATGKAILVFRDFPLSFHNPLATKEALAAECVQELGDNAKYFAFHDLVYSTTNSNGNGLEEAKLYEFAKQVGVDTNNFTQCYQQEKFKDEIAKDIADGTAAGINGTPGFVIGLLSSDGSVDGVNVAGALPYENFVQVMEEQLAR